jgi:hypothetical protein
MGLCMFSVVSTTSQIKIKLQTLVGNKAVLAVVDQCFALEETIDYHKSKPFGLSFVFIAGAILPVL